MGGRSLLDFRGGKYSRETRVKYRNVSVKWCRTNTSAGLRQEARSSNHEIKETHLNHADWDFNDEGQTSRHQLRHALRNNQVTQLRGELRTNKRTGNLRNNQSMNVGTNCGTIDRTNALRRAVFERMNVRRRRATSELGNERTTFGTRELRNELRN